MLQTISYRTLSFRIDRKITKDVFHKLWTLSNEHALLYNDLLSKVWDRLENNKKIDFKQINQDYVNFRNHRKLTIPSKSAQNTSRVLMTNIKSYYALRKNDATARFPKRFKSTRRFQTFTYDWNSGAGGFKIKNNILVLLKPEIAIPIPEYILKDANFDDVKTVNFFERNGNIYCSFCVAIYTKDNCLDPTRHLSIDPGIKTLITGVTCDGKIIQFDNLNYSYQDKSNDKIRSKRDKKKKYSSRYKRLSNVLRRNMKKTSNRRKDYQHKVTKQIVNFCIDENIGTIIHGDIKTKSLPKSKVANKNLNRATQNRGALSQVKQFLAYKASSNGIVHILQNEAYTSKTNCLTGEIMQNMNLSMREIELTEGLIIDRDVNGAINIATKYYSQNTGVWYPQLSWLKALKNAQIKFNLRMSKFN